MQNNIKLLFEIGQITLTSEELKLKLKKILKVIANDLNMHKVMLTILNRKTGEIFIEDAVGLTKDEVSKGIYRSGEGIIGSVIETGNSKVIPRIAQEPLFLNRTGSLCTKEKNGMSYICVPIKMHEEVIGALSGEQQITDPETLQHNLHLMSVIATMISQSVRLHQIEHEERELLRAENARLQSELHTRYKPDNMISNSSQMDEVFKLISKIADTNSTVLILGESGVGKELIANAIHYNSNRSNKPFIKFNCSALPESVIESELFGHEKGAFTGAISSRKGRFELAQCGTVFLDEIGELSLPIQAKLLRVLQEREVERVGGTEVIKLDVRIITATNRDLTKMIKEGLFREDLYYRLNVFPITVPPLRQRHTDILPLANFFISKVNKESNKNVRRISTPAIDMLMSYHWPGNVRELENIIERAVILSEDAVIHAYHLPPTLQTASSSGTEDYQTLSQKLEMVEKEFLIEAIKNEKGNLAKAAKSLGLTERIIGLRVRKYKIDFRKFRFPTST